MRRKRPVYVVAAYALGVLFPLAETLRRRTDFSEPHAYIDDFLVGAFLLLAARSFDRRRPFARLFLAAAWGAVLGGMYGSFFGHWFGPDEPDVSGLPKGFVVAVKGLAFAAAGWFCLRAVVDPDPWVEPRIAVTESPREIAIDGHIVRGQAWIQRCGECGGATGWLEEFDAALCPACDRWAHHTCALGSSCPYCAKRPASPMSFVRAAPSARARVGEP